MRKFPAILLASLNNHKLDEFAALFRSHNIKVVGPGEYVRNSAVLKHVEAHTKATTYFDNAKAKALAAFGAAKVPTFADDSGIEVEALQGQPGVKSAVYADGTDADRRKKLLGALKGQKNRRARFRCVLAFVVEGVTLKAEGTCEGVVAESEAGDHGFGYDSLFLPDGGNGKTFAQLSPEEKNQLSHRNAAVKALVAQLQERNIEFVRP